MRFGNSMLQDKIVDAKIKKDGPGHISEEVNMIYIHVADETQRAVSEKVWKMLLKTTQTKPVSLKVAGKEAKDSPMVVSSDLSH